MKDFDIQKEIMIEKHLINRGIENSKILEVFRVVPRENFISDENQREAYGDYPLPIGSGQTTSQPYIIAKMLELLNIEKEDKVLEIGTGSGYQTALLSLLSNNVFSVERVKSLYLEAKSKLEKFNFNTTHLKLGDGSLGWEEFSLYDKIVVSAASPKIPQTLINQLKDNGKLIIPIGSRFSQVLTVVKKSKKGYTYMEDERCIFVPLIGKEGWKE